MKSGSKWPILGLIGGLLFVAAAYLPACFSYFQLDDWGHIRMAAFPTDGPWHFGGWFYRPIFNIAFRHLYGMFGLNAFAWHAVTISLHLVNVALVYALARRIGFVKAPALAAALLFGLYPDNTEAVTWLSAFSGIIATSCGLAAALILLGDRFSPLPRTLLAFAVWIVGCLSKQEAASLAFVLPFLPTLVAYRSIHLHQGEWKKPIWNTLRPSIARFALFSAGVAVLCILERHCTHHLGNPGISLSLRTLISASTAVTYMTPGIVTGFMLSQPWYAARPVPLLVLQESACPTGLQDQCDHGQHRKLEYNRAGFFRKPPLRPHLRDCVPHEVEHQN